MRNRLFIAVTALTGLFAWCAPASAGWLSSTGPVIAIFGGELFLGEAEGHLDGAGTIQIHSRTNPELGCRGEFTSSAELGGVGSMRCSDGITASFQFQRLSITRGYGTGSSSRGALSFTYGLSSSESGRYLRLPPGKMLSLGDMALELVDLK